MQSVYYFATAYVHFQGAQDGCTATACLVRGHELWIANAGDSRTILVKQDSVVQVTIDHKPNEPNEKARILAAGGSIIFYGVWRVNGMIFHVLFAAASLSLCPRHVGHFSWLWRCFSQTRSSVYPRGLSSL